MSTDMVKHHLAFIRKEGFGAIENLWVVEVLMIDPEAGLDDAWRGLRNAVTDWVAETVPGREAWTASSEDFNIGDFFSISDASGLAPFLFRHGIYHVNLLYQMGEGEEIGFDRILVDRSRLEEEGE